MFIYKTKQTSSLGNYGSPSYYRKIFESLTGSCLLDRSIQFFSNLQICRKSLYHLQEMLKINIQCVFLYNWDAICCLSNWKSEG